MPVGGRRRALSLPRVHGDVVVVAVHGQKGGRADGEHQVEAQNVAVEVRGVVQIAHVQVDVPDSQTVDWGGGWFLAGDQREEVVCVERARPTLGELLVVARPRFRRAVRGQLQAVTVGIGR